MDTGLDRRRQQIRDQLLEDTFNLVQPILALLVSLGVIFVSLLWEDALFFLIFVCFWAIWWILSLGVAKALTAIWRIPVNLVALYVLGKRLKQT